MLIIIFTITNVNYVKKRNRLSKLFVDAARSHNWITTRQSHCNVTLELMSNEYHAWKMVGAQARGKKNRQKVAGEKAVGL